LCAKRVWLVIADMVGGPARVFRETPVRRLDVLCRSSRRWSKLVSG